LIRIWIYKPEIRNHQDLVGIKLANEAVSMEPTLHPDDIVVMDRTDKEITPKGIFAVRTNDPFTPCTVKRLRAVQGKFWLISDNS